MTAPLERTPELPEARYWVEIDCTSESEWSSLIAGFEDVNVYQTWSYGALRWGEPSLSHIVLRRDGEAVAAAQLRIVRPRLIRCGIAYLRWGPLFEPWGRPPAVEDVCTMAEALRNEYVTKRGLFLQILPNAFSSSERAQIIEEAFQRFRTPQRERRAERTLLLDLAPPLEHLRAQLDRKWRNHLNRAERNGLSITEGSGSGEWEIFRQIYWEMWTRKRFEIGADVDQFARIAAALPDQFKLRVLICWHEGTPVAGLVCTAMGDTGICLFAATSDRGMQTQGSYLLQWDTVKWLKERGFRYYDLGGIDPVGNPGVYSFKRGLGGADVARMASLEACDSLASALCAKAADAARGPAVAPTRRLARRVKLALERRA